MVVDELICEIKEGEKDLHVSEHVKVAVLGYADDLILLAVSIRYASRMLAKAREAFFKKRGLIINADKSIALTTNYNKGNKNLYAITVPLFYINAALLKQLQPGKVFKYLGGRYDAMGQTLNTFDELKIQLALITSARLKPSRNLHIIRTYLLP